ncbi:MAG TPA: zinc ribbon domain-containing protein [Thermoleophilaceae bacterium]|jgi:hypothetical protein
MSHDAELATKRERLTERFTVMQSDLGGLVYEMVIRDSVQMEVLKRKVAELQRVDAELGYLEQAIKAEDSGVAGACPECEAPYARGAAFCWRCGHSLVAVEVVEPGA